MNRIVPCPRNAAAGDDVERLSDHDLLDRFVTNRDEAAFAAVVQRHGAMVLGVCGRVLRDATEAEDAFQATFLAFVRKARTIRKKASLASWLYGVAYHVATNARRGLARRASHEAISGEIHARRSAGEATWREVQLLLDEELKQLPERFRIPLVLCYLEGKTRDEAAHEVGWSLGTFRGRLDCGRELLRARLIRRGLTLSTALFAGALTQGTASAAVPPVLAGATVKAGMLYATGNVAHECGIPPHIVALARTVLQVALAGKLKLAATAILGLSLVSTGTVLVVTRERGADKPAESAEMVAPDQQPDRAAVNAGVTAPEPVPVVPQIAVTQRGRTYVDLQPYANQPLKESFHFDGNNLANLPTGEQRLAGVNFKIESRLIQLSCGGAADVPQKVEGIKLGTRFSRLSILHATHFYAEEDQVIGHYTVNYVDRTREMIPIVYGKDLCNWWWTEGFAVPSRTKVAWEGTNAYLTNTTNPRIRLYLMRWQNPKPSRKISTIDFSSTNTAAAPFCVAITAEK